MSARWILNQHFTLYLLVLNIEHFNWKKLLWYQPCLWCPSFDHNNIKINEIKFETWKLWIRPNKFLVTTTIIFQEMWHIKYSLSWICQFWLKRVFCCCFLLLLLELAKDFLRTEIKKQTASFYLSQSSPISECMDFKESIILLFS